MWAMMVWSRLKSFYAHLSTLQMAIGLSVAVHVLLITVRFVDPVAFNRVFKDTPLEVILVNAKSSEKLENSNAQVQAIAQFSLNGGGDAASGLSSSPLPSSALTDIGMGAEKAQAEVRQLEAQQTRLLSDLKEQIAQMAKPDPKMTDQSQRDEVEKKRQQLMQLLGAIERRINAQNAKPKKRYVSPAIRQEAYAQYYDDLRRKIERRGTDNFPEAAGRKLYGELTMLMTVNFDGKILDLEISGSGSGDKMLDARAKAIVLQASPYGAFTPAMRSSADQLVVVSRFQFTKDQQLEAKVQAQ
jgi:protein TonB